MTVRSTAHSTFVIERTFPASPERVFGAFSSLDAKRRWFHGPQEWGQGEHLLEFRVGGRERTSGGPPGGVVHTMEGRFEEIVPDTRIISTYSMFLDDTRISVSLATVDLAPTAGGTKLVYTEQMVYLDGNEQPGLREQGTRGLFEQLERALAREA